MDRPGEPACNVFDRISRITPGGIAELRYDARLAGQHGREQRHGPPDHRFKPAAQARRDFSRRMTTIENVPVLVDNLDYRQVPGKDRRQRGVFAGCTVEQRAEVAWRRAGLIAASGGEVHNDIRLAKPARQGKRLESVGTAALALAQHQPLELKQRIQPHRRRQCGLGPGDLNACALILQWQGRTDHPLPRPLAIAAKFDNHSRLTPLTRARYKPSMIST